jgi:hypothetical protein
VLAKVVSRILGVPTDDVRKRQVIAQNWRLKVTSAVVAVFTVLSVVTGFLVWERVEAHESERLREKAAQARESERRILEEAARDKLLAVMRGMVHQGDARLQEGLDLVRANKSQDAERLFQAVAEEKAARADRTRLENDRKAAATAYRNLGAIADLNDPKRAQEAYAKAREYDGEGSPDKESGKDLPAHSGPIAAPPSSKPEPPGGKSTGPRTRANWKRGHYSLEDKAERARVRSTIVAWARIGHGYQLTLERK